MVIIRSIGLCLLCVSTSWSITVGQTDDFEDGTTQSWAWGRTGFGGPEVVSDGQPAENLYLQNESFGGSDAPGSRMAIINREQWTGDFIGAGVTAIRLDAINLGPNFAFEDMTLRLGFSSDSALQGSGRVVTNDGFQLLRDGGWQELVFDLSNLTAIAGSDLEEVMSSVTEMRIMSAEQPMFTGDRFIARLGIDDLQAVPEPHSCGAMLLALMLFASFSRTTGKHKI